MEQIVRVEKYEVKPASNGWVISWDAVTMGYSRETVGYIVVCKTSTEVATFFRSLDKNRDKAKKLTDQKDRAEKLSGAEEP